MVLFPNKLENDKWKQHREVSDLLEGHTPGWQWAPSWATCLASMYFVLSPDTWGSEINTRQIPVAQGCGFLSRTSCPTRPSMSCQNYQTVQLQQELNGVLGWKNWPGLNIGRKGDRGSAKVVFPLLTADLANEQCWAVKVLRAAGRVLLPTCPEQGWSIFVSCLKEGKIRHRCLGHVS